MTPFPAQWGMLLDPEFQRKMRGQGLYGYSPDAALQEGSIPDWQSSAGVDLGNPSTVPAGDPSIPQFTVEDAYNRNNQEAYQYPPPLSDQYKDGGFTRIGAPDAPQGNLSTSGVGVVGQKSSMNGALPISLLAAGLGILANNTGHYGAAGPAIGKGGLIGVQAYGEERDRQTRDAQMKQQNRMRDEQLAINRKQAGYLDRRATRQENIDTELADARKALMNAKTPEERQRASERLAALSENPEALLKMFGPQKPVKPDTQEGAVLDKNGQPTIDKRSGQPVIQQYAFNPQTNAYDIPAGGLRLASGGLNVNFGQPFAGVDPKTGESRMYQPSPQGGARPMDIAPVTTGKITDTERATKGYHDRMVAAEKLIAGIGAPGEPNEATAIARGVPIVGAYAERSMMTPEQQKYKQAQMDWVRAKLRKESGAVIGAQEMIDEVITYFPQPGDTPEVIDQKRASRDVAIRALADAAGPALGLPSPRGDFQQQSTFGGGDLPKSARMALKEGQITTFGNGQAWTLQGGKPVRVK